MDPETESILNSARNNISTFCITECNAYCCRKGYLVLTPTQAKATMQGKEDEYRNKGFLKPMTDGNFSLYMGDKDHPCPSLDNNNRCLIHKNPDRAETCAIFPIHIKDNTIHVSKRCLAANAGLLYPYIAQLVKKGFVLPGK
jgi:Fe-S-cluster containining protein